MILPSLLQYPLQSYMQLLQREISFQCLCHKTSFLKAVFLCGTSPSTSSGYLLFEDALHIQW